MNLELFQENTTSENVKNDFLLFVDVETTGFPERGGYLSHDLLTWSGIITDKELNILDKRTVKSKCISPKHWSEEAEKVHGISFFEAVKFQEPRSACIEIMNFVKPFKEKTNTPFIWVEHSLNHIDYLFTMGLFLKADLWMRVQGLFDKKQSCRTVKLARKKGYKKNRLNEWAERIDIELNHHNSESDVMACYEVFKYLTQGKIDKSIFC